MEVSEASAAVMLSPANAQHPYKQALPSVEAGYLKCLAKDIRQQPPELARAQRVCVKIGKEVVVG